MWLFGGGGGNWPTAAERKKLELFWEPITPNTERRKGAAPWAGPGSDSQSGLYVPSGFSLKNEDHDAAHGENLQKCLAPGPH